MSRPNSSNWFKHWLKVSAHCGVNTCRLLGFSRIAWSETMLNRLMHQANRAWALKINVLNSGREKKENLWILSSLMGEDCINVFSCCLWLDYLHFGREKICVAFFLFVYSANLVADVPVFHYSPNVGCKCWTWKPIRQYTEVFVWIAEYLSFPVFHSAPVIFPLYLPSLRD